MEDISQSYIEVELTDEDKNCLMELFSYLPDVDSSSNDSGSREPINVEEDLNSKSSGFHENACVPLNEDFGALINDSDSRESINDEEDLNNKSQNGKNSRVPFNEDFGGFSSDSDSRESTNDEEDLNDKSLNEENARMPLNEEEDINNKSVNDENSRVPLDEEEDINNKSVNDENSRVSLDINKSSCTNEKTNNQQMLSDAELLRILEDAPIEPEELLQKMFEEAKTPTKETSAPTASTQQQSNGKPSLKLNLIKIEPVIDFTDDDAPKVKIEKDEVVASKSISIGIENGPLHNEYNGCKSQASTSSQFYTDPEEGIEDGELLSDNDVDSQELVSKEYSQNITNCQRDLTDEGNKIAISEYHKATNSVSTEVSYPECMNNIKSIVQNESKKQMKKFAKINEKQLSNVIKVMNRILEKDETKEAAIKHKIESSNNKKIPHKIKSEDRTISLRQCSTSTSSSSSPSSGDDLPSQYKTVHESRKSRYALSPKKNYGSHSSLKKRKKYHSSSDSSSDKKSHSNSKCDKSLKVYKSSSAKTRKHYTDTRSSSCSSPEMGNRKYASSSSNTSPNRYNMKKRHKRAPCSSPSRKSYSNTQAVSANNMSTSKQVFNSSLCNRPSNSNCSYPMENNAEKNIIRGRSIIRSQTTVTTTYEAQLQDFAAKVRSKRNHSDSDSESDDSVSRLELRVYDDNNVDVTKIRPGGDIYHTFYIHPEDVELYRVRLKKGTQPVQALHEICVKCGWELPTYLNLPSQQGFKFGMILQGHHFITSKAASQKKLARAEASKIVLQWLRVLDIN